MSAARQRPVVLTILDGFGLRAASAGNAIRLANTPCLDRLLQDYPNSRLQASGLAVGLPEGQMGNSEVGHLNIGAGRTVYQDLTRINKSIADGDFFTNEVLCTALEQIKTRGGALHLLGLLSDGGVHSMNTHLYALVEMALKVGIESIQIHPFLDGRDTPPRSAMDYLYQLERKLAELGGGRIATISGRFYAMDRDKRWERVERAYRAMVHADAPRFASSAQAISSAYANDISDEFVEPCVIGTPAPVRDGDGIIFFNFRADRAREITTAFTVADFDGFTRGPLLDLSAYVCMTEYDEQLNLPVAFPVETYPDILAEVVAAAGLKQLHIAETEKYAHVTFFFNGGNEQPYPGEERVLVPSPKEVATYDEKPQMSAATVADEVCQRISTGTFDLVILNFANPDMVGHTGILDAAIAAVETVDRCLCQVVETTLKQGGCLLVTADHGNCEQMIAADGKPHTAHTTNPVPLIYIGDDAASATLADGSLRDIAPTLLTLLGLDVPAAMSGQNLLSKS